jgi:hypothetical protein
LYRGGPLLDHLKSVKVIEEIPPPSAGSSFNSPQTPKGLTANTSAHKNSSFTLVQLHPLQIYGN